MRKGLLIYALALLSIACQKEEAERAAVFVKSYGLQGNSRLNDVLELANGDLLFCGQVSKPAFISNASSDISGGTLEESSPALILTDAEGNLKEQRLYPINYADIDPAIEIDDLYGLANFLEVLPLANGGYLVHGEFRGFGFDIPTVNLSRERSTSNSTPFLARFNANLEMLEFQNLNGSPPWDRRLYSGGVLKAKPDQSGFVFMIGFSVGFPGGFLGYRLMELDENGQEIKTTSFYNSSELKFARDFTFLNDDEIGVVGQLGGDYQIFRVDAGSFFEFTKVFLAPDGTNQTFNDNAILIEKLAGGEVFCFYTQPVEINYMHILDSRLASQSKEDLEPDHIDQYPLKSNICRNGDVLLTCIDLEDEFIERSHVYRISPEGEVHWKRTYNGRVQQIKESADGGIFVLADLFYSGGNRKGTFYKISANGTF
ncbi:MAG: hypothetical protein NXI09_01255 [Bacteroidetes bacterium]|nr:hypothetical protein [Bacteroidota bacterium]